jgi:hypothetical protein
LQDSPASGRTLLDMIYLRRLWFVLTVHLGYDACAFARADDTSEAAYVVAVRVVKATNMPRESFMLVCLLSCLQRESNGKRPLSNECTGDRTKIGRE